jgi:DNA polymerase-3 subunit epsilon
MNFVALDFETANPDPASACSLGIVTVKNGIITDTYHSFIKPRKVFFDKHFTAIHGITEDVVKNSPEFPDLWDSYLKQYIEEYVIAAHNASFDMNVLRHLFSLYNISNPQINCLCTLKIAKDAFPELDNYKLNTIVSHLHINPGHHHESLPDAYACASILIKSSDILGLSTIYDFLGRYSVNTLDVKTDHDFWHADNLYIHYQDNQIKRIQSSYKVKVIDINKENQCGLINDYSVDLQQCNCRDFTLRRKPCKHMYRLVIELGILDVKNRNILVLRKSREV